MLIHCSAHKIHFLLFVTAGHGTVISARVVQNNLILQDCSDYLVAEKILLDTYFNVLNLTNSLCLPKLIIRKKSFMYDGAKLWNSIP